MRDRATFGRPRPGQDADVEVVAYVALILVSGLIVGALARFALHGKDPMSLTQTMAVGVVGSLVGGLLAAALGGSGERMFALPIQVGCATAIVYWVRRRRERQAERTGFR
jgi:uncharacterized membrane protein YeaQ/YmgE (transglycosylase-associated protein family)